MEESNQKNTSRPVLMILIGIPASGKSSFVETLKDSYQIVNGDKIRRQIFNVQWDEDLEHFVWEIAKLQTRSHLRNGRNVIIDATNLKGERRKIFTEIGQEFNAIIYGMIFLVPFDIALRRDMNREEGKKVGKEVMELMKKDYMRLWDDLSILFSEGFEHLKFQYSV